MSPAATKKPTVTLDPKREDERALSRAAGRREEPPRGGVRHQGDQERLFGCAFVLDDLMHVLRADAAIPPARLRAKRYFTFQTALKLQMLGSYLGPELVSDGRNAVFSGPSGTKKTHLAIATAYRAIQHGYEARFVSADALIGHLSHAAAKGRLEAALHPHVLVIDELGYLFPRDRCRERAYRVVNERYLKQRPMLLTTKEPLAALGDVLHDGDLAEAILDRHLERGTHFALRGRSYRTKHLSEEETTTRRAKTA
jgi:hypothetical protein